MSSNTAVKATPFGRWTQRDRVLHSAPYLLRDGEVPFIRYAPN